MPIVCLRFLFPPYHVVSSIAPSLCRAMSSTHHIAVSLIVHLSCHRVTSPSLALSVFRAISLYDTPISLDPLPPYYTCMHPCPVIYTCLSAPLPPCASPHTHHPSSNPLITTYHLTPHLHILIISISISIPPSPISPLTPLSLPKNQPSTIKKPDVPFPSTRSRPKTRKTRVNRSWSNQGFGGCRTV